MTAIDSLRRAGDQFRSMVASIADDQWGLATPCGGWTVRQVVGHVTSGSEMAAVLAEGASRQQAIALLGVDHLGDDPLSAVEHALERQQSAFEEPDVGVRLLHHPAGDITGAQAIAFRLADLLVHRWDLARAVGADETLDPDLVREVWHRTASMIPTMTASGVFGDGPSGTVGDDAPLQTRLLDAMGRRP